MSESIDRFDCLRMPWFTHHIFNGERYAIFEVRDHPYCGYCDAGQPEDRERILWIKRRDFDVYHLMVMVHESLHACFGDKLSESSVEVIANDIAAFVGKFLIATCDPARKQMGYKPIKDTPVEELKKQVDEAAGSKFLQECKTTREGRPRFPRMR